MILRMLRPATGGGQPCGGCGCEAAFGEHYMLLTVHGRQLRADHSACLLRFNESLTADEATAVVRQAQLN